ncbi:hypothetical protein HF086_007204 [Spodoptera exigua]|uniref:Blastoderm-specific protein 25D n=1 Tax=Spodoptera exigua TaxID=7107 RepID=A0A922MSX6_SPOEX|nr:hypothetical protein HF086_007204 [Spodoptera exigua]
MDDVSMNRYEKQLYSVFKTFDVDNEEALDRSAVHKLCDALQLEDRGATLVNTLFERRSGRVTFAQFRNGLLAVLGASGAEPVRVLTAPSDAATEAAPHHSDDDSSGREVAPKFVFGSKKYGRRSRPTRSGAAADEPTSPRSSSASRLDTDDKKAKQRMRCRRSASAMETRGDNENGESSQPNASSTNVFEHDRRIDRDEAFALCRDLNMDGIDQQLIERIFNDTSDTTVGEFFDRLNAELTTTMEEASRDVPSSATITDAIADVALDDASSGLPSDLVLEAWERAGVQQPRRLLTELGFSAVALSLTDLEHTLDDELRAVSEPSDEPRDARTLLLLAALTLSRLRLELTRRRVDVTTAERDKLRGDVAEANRHARLLAQEVDESHARIEAELKASLRRAEARHAESMRQAAAEHAAERERAAAARARLEAEVTRRAELEARLRGEMAGLRDRADELEGRVAAAEERCTETERERARLAGELRAALEQGAAARSCDVPAELAEQLSELRRDNQRLRDRNDELCAALEARIDREANQYTNRECDSSPVSIEQTRILSHVEAITKLGEMFDSVLALPPGVGDRAACQHCAASAAALRRLRAAVADLGDTLLCAPEPCHRAAQTDRQPDADSDALRRDLLDAERRHDDEKRKLTNLVKELEASLEQMKAEYDKCEEYWSNKLEEERELFSEEQRLGDERLGELVAKISEYERQFAPAAALPTIDERHSLEAQFTDLEEEFARYRRDKEAELSARGAELARLAERLAAAERRRAAPPRRPRRPLPRRPRCGSCARARRGPRRRRGGWRRGWRPPTCSSRTSTSRTASWRTAAPCDTLPLPLPLRPRRPVI